MCWWQSCLWKSQTTLSPTRHLIIRTDGWISLLKLPNNGKSPKQNCWDWCYDSSMPSVLLLFYDGTFLSQSIGYDDMALLRGVAARLDPARLRVLDLPYGKSKVTDETKNIHSPHMQLCTFLRQRTQWVQVWKYSLFLSTLVLEIVKAFYNVVCHPFYCLLVESFSFCHPIAILSKIYMFARLLQLFSSLPNVGCALSTVNMQ